MKPAPRTALLSISAPQLLLLLQLLQLLLLLDHTCPVAADGSISVRFSRYENPDGTGENGHCCDGKWSVCQYHGCDYIFKICLNNERNSGETCVYGQRVSNRLHNQDSVQFANYFGGVRNPMVFPFPEALAGEVVLMVDVWDHDSFSANDHVDLLTHAEVLTAGPPQTVLLRSRTSLLVQLQVVCDADWYTRDCGVHCPAPSTNDHYRCHPQSGQRVCEDGWIGEECDRRSTSPPPTTTTISTAEANPGRTITFPVEHVNANCDSLAKAGRSYHSGSFLLLPDESTPFAAYCNITDGQEGWTVIQRRVDGSVNFNRTWQEYRDGFGEVGANTEYWVGLENIYQLTLSTANILRIIMQTGSGEFRYAEYGLFWVSGEVDNYTLYVFAYDGNAGNALDDPTDSKRLSQNFLPFSTWDRDNDGSQGNCAQMYQSGWWFNDCYRANLNGPYVDRETCPDSGCIAWMSGGEQGQTPLRRVEMSIKPQ